LLPAELPQSLYLSYHPLQHFLGARYPGLQRHNEFSPPLSPACVPQTTGRRPHQVPTDSLIRKGDSSSVSQGEGLNAQRNPLRHRSQLKSTALCTSKNLGSCLGRKKGSLIISRRLIVTACLCIVPCENM
jgi:hypothetical protein